MESLSQRLRREQLRDITAHLPHTVGVGLAVTVMCVSVVWPAIPKGILIPGLATIGFLAGLRILLSIRWFRSLESDVEIKRGLNLLVFSACGNGIVWFVFLITMFQSIGEGADTFGYYVMICASIFGLSAGAMSFYTAYMPVFLAFVIPANLGGASLLLVADNFALRFTGLIFLGYLLGSVISAKNSFRRYTDFVFVKFRNLDLLDAYRRQKDIAESSSRAKSRFLAAASHDLRQPIHAIGLLADTLESQAGTPDIKILSKSISESVYDLTSLLEVILDISKIDAGLIQADARPFQISRLFSNIEKTYSQEAQDKKLQLRVRDSDQIAFSDYALLERILNNLVANAIKYTETGGVLLAARKRGTKLRIDVWDTGIGIPESSVDEVFLEYYQIGNLARAETEGLGLGLSIVKGLCDALGYPIRVRSVHGSGTVFSLAVPMAAEGSSEQPVASHSVLRKSDANILLIDDDTRVLGATNQLLKNRGYQVRIAQDSNGAIDIIERGFMPDIVFCDYRLSGEENGSEVLNLLRDKYGDGIHGVLITADTDPQRLIEATASGYLLRHKPLSADLLGETIIDLMNPHDASTPKDHLD